MSVDTTGNPRIDSATAEIAILLRDANPGQRDQHYYDGAMELRLFCDWLVCVERYLLTFRITFSLSSFSPADPSTFVSMLTATGLYSSGAYPV